MSSNDDTSPAPVDAVVHTPRMPMADCSLRGKDFSDVHGDRRERRVCRE